MNTNVLQPTDYAPTPEQILLRLEWKVIRHLDGVLLGDYRTIFYGEGFDFADLREYQSEDDIRHIDWNVTARMNRLHVRQYIEDRDVTAWFLVDLSPSMTFGPAERPKETVLIDLVTTLSRLLVRNGNRVGAILYKGSNVRTIPPRSGRIQVLRLARELIRDIESQTRELTDLGVLLKAGMNTFKKRSLVFVISDFISKPGWPKYLSMLNRRHEMIGIRLWDPREVELPNAGMLLVEDLETGEQLQVDTSNLEFRHRFYAAAEQRELELKADLKHADVDLYSISTEESLIGAIVRMAAKRKKRRR